MTPRDDVGRPRPGLRVLILDQGEYSQPAVDAVMSAINEMSPDTAIHAKPLGSHPNGMTDADIHRLFLEELGSCDAAIALITPDKRWASRAGNIWIEIGTWTALKPHGTLLVCVQKGPLEGVHYNFADKQWADRLPTNIVGRVAPPFHTINQLKTLATKHVLELITRFLQEADADTPYPDTLRVRDTLLPDLKQNEAETLRRCHTSGEERLCAYQQHSLCFASELLRMDKTHQEHNVIAARLQELATQCNAALTSDADQALAPNIQRDKRQLAMRNIRDVLERLHAITDELLTRSSQLELLDPWKRLTLYLQYRLDRAAALLEARPASLPLGIGPAKECNSFQPAQFRRLRDKAEAFIGWAQQYATSDDYVHCEFYDTGPDLITHRKVSAQEDIEYAAEFSCYASIALRILGESFFADSRKAIGNELPAVGGIGTVADAFETICGALAHNSGGEEALEIWPRSKDPQTVVS